MARIASAGVQPISFGHDTLGRVIRTVDVEGEGWVEVAPVTDHFRVQRA
ncbi:hypothetical protein QTH97_30175 [Variovorax sp. J22R24]|nr:hypothetical protein [Variovorax sp. J22R24]MDM0109240.1 hypothetical protein [Variovorax sp. J22R24]